MEIIPYEVLKKNAAFFPHEKYGFDRLVGFGDNLNDIPLFDACDVKIAAANAVDEVKKCADFIIGNNTDDSVPQYIEKFFR